MKQIEIALQEAQSMKDVVDIINNEDGHYYGERDADTLAAEYVYYSLQYYGDENYTEDEIEAQLDILKDLGAKFDYQIAKKIAMSYVGGEI
jgi:hypothetical protein